MDTVEPVRGFVYRRKQFFASLENLLDRGSGSSSRTKTANKNKKWHKSQSSLDQDDIGHGFGQGTESSGENQDNNGSGTLTKWQSLPLLDQVAQVPSVSSNPDGKNIIEEMENVEEEYTHMQRTPEEKESRPHWTVLFSQRLNQIRHKFEHRCKSDGTRLTGGSATNGYQKNGYHGSMSNLVVAARVSQVEHVSKRKRDMAKSCGDLYMASITNNNGSCNRKSTGAAIKYRPSTTVRKTTMKEVTRLKNVSPGIRDRLEAITQQRSKKPMYPAPLREEIPEMQIICDHSKWFSDGHPPASLIYKPYEGHIVNTFAGPKEVGVSSQIVEQNSEVVKVNGDGQPIKSIPPVLVPSQGFTADEKIKDRITLKNWDPVSVTIL